ncbi:hypothetical protein SAPIO_CDS4484 [Scedosporium apiospermum]|uniref:Uncharacterized protein n=1 Tax=Pseudallescheria apiosperma TaxID=563466 RepID=A0A084G8A2_PSEDA|nr:uncharacterized protein SAPIO_CDS4484 [Scedosporium apiospermum]KEZ43564.1 hypothetical protein SAPIO_CDS4484 [Scedosporium apiospermum]
MASIDPAATADVLSKTLSEITEHSQIYIHPNAFPFATAAIRRILSLLTQALLATMSLAAGPLVDDRLGSLASAHPPTTDTTGGAPDPLAITNAALPPGPASSPPTGPNPVRRAAAARLHPS